MVSGKYNATSVRKKTSDEFKAWLKTIPEEFRESVTAHRRTYIAVALNRGKHEYSTKRRQD